MKYTKKKSFHFSGVNLKEFFSFFIRFEEKNLSKSRVGNSIYITFRNSDTRPSFDKFFDCFPLLDEKLIKNIDISIMAKEFFMEIFIDLDENKLSFINTVRDFVGEELMSQMIEEFQLKEFATVAKDSEVEVVIGNHSLCMEVFNHIKEELEDGHYNAAVTESMKLLKEQYRNLTGKEKAGDAFGSVDKEDGNCSQKIFGEHWKTQSERDFREGLKHLCLSLDMFRNSMFHSVEKIKDRDTALEYLTMISFAYKNISIKK